MNAKLMRRLGAAAALAALPATVSAQAPCDDTYIVSSGETLAAVADRCEVSLWALIRLNPGLSGADPLRPGQALRIPGLRGVDAGDALADPGAARGSGLVVASHEVEAGQTLAEIAARYGVTVAALLGANDLEDPNVLRIGQRLAIPGEAPARGVAPDPATLPGVPRVNPGATDVDAGDEPSKRVAAITGTLTDEGVECRALRGDDGRLYTLAGGVPFPDGTRVTVVGSPAEVSTCMQGTTLTVEDIAPARPEGDAAGDAASPPVVYRLQGTYFEGAECPALRTEQGRIYSLSGMDMAGVAEGETIAVEGTRARVSFCGQGTTLVVRELRRQGG